MTRIVRGGSRHAIVETCLGSDLKLLNKCPWTFFLDISGSMAFCQDRVKASLIRFSQMCHEDSIASIQTFRDKCTLWTNNQTLRTMDWTQMPRASGGTNQEDLFAEIQKLSGPQDVILFSDGVPTVGQITSIHKQDIESLWTFVLPVLSRCVNQGIRIHTMAQDTGGLMPIDFLSQVSNSTGGIHHCIENVSNLLDDVFVDVLCQQDAFIGIVKDIQIDGHSVLREVPLNASLGLHKSLRKCEKVSWLIDSSRLDGHDHCTSPRVVLADGTSVSLAVLDTIENAIEVQLHELRVEGLDLLNRTFSVPRRSEHPLQDFFDAQVAKIQKHPSQSDADGILRRIEKVLAIHMPHPDALFENDLNLQQTQVLSHGLSAQRDSIGVASPFGPRNSMRTLGRRSVSLTPAALSLTHPTVQTLSSDPESPIL